MIRLGERTPLVEARRAEIGLTGLAALQRALAATDGLSLPADLVVDETALGLAIGDLERAVEHAETALRDNGLLDAHGVVDDAVLANLTALTRSPRRIRTSLHGRATSVIAHHWADPTVGGSLVRDGQGCTLSAFDARALGDEVLRVLPDPGEAAAREGFTTPIEALSVIGAIDDLPADETTVVAHLLGVDADTATRLREWTERVEAVLHVSVIGDDPAALPGMLVWFLDQRGWWSARSVVRQGTRVVEVRPRRRADLVAATGALLARAWAVA